MQTLYNQQVSSEKWVSLLKSTAYVTPFQEPEWYHFHKEIQDPNQIPFVVAVEENNNTLVALISGMILCESGWKKNFTKRAILTGGPLIRDQVKDEQRIVSVLLKELSLFLKKEGVIYGEFRNLNDYSNYKNLFTKEGWLYQEHLNFLVDCHDKDLMWKKLSSGRRRDINYGKKKGATIRLSTSDDEVENWYSILQLLYRDKVKTPLPKLEYFKKSLRRENSRLIVVDHESEIIGGLFGVFTQKTVFCDMFCCGLDNEYKAQRIYPSILATWGAMELTHNEGIPRFDFMGAGKPGVPYGVRDFKAKFGGELVEYGRFIKVFSPFRYIFGKCAVFIKKKLS